MRPIHHSSKALSSRKDFLNEDFVQLFPEFVGEKG